MPPGSAIPSKSRGDIDAVAHQVAVALLDDIAQMNADAELDAALRWQASVALDHAVLHLDGAANGVNHAAKLDEDAIAGALDHASVMQRRWWGRSDRSGARAAAPASAPRRQPASLLYPTTSAARMAASFRVSAMAALHHTPD